MSAKRTPFRNSERKKGIEYAGKVGFLSFVVILFGQILVYPLFFTREAVLNGTFNAEFVDWLIGYFTTLPTPEGFIYWMQQWYDLVRQSFPLEFLLFLIVPAGVGYHFWTKNPYDMEDMAHGTARFATLKDVQIMNVLMNPKDPAAKKGYIITLGKYQGQWLAMNETLTVLAAAPPGTGKTTAVCIPTILKCDYEPGSGAPISMVINDVKPELFYMTSGYMSKRADCWQLNFGITDNPLKGQFYPRWNFLSPDAVPAFGSDRDMYIDNMAAVILPDQPGAGKDDFWIKAARAACTGLLHYIVCKVERANLQARLDGWFFENGPEAPLSDFMQSQVLFEMHRLGYDGPLKAEVEANTLTEDKLRETPIGTFDGIPERWWANEIEPEPSMPMLLDAMTELKIRFQEEQRRKEKEAEASGDAEQMVAQAMMAKKDAEAAAFELMVEEAVRFNYHRRSVMEIQELAGLAPETRTSIMKNFDTGVNIFKNTAVQERTTRSDFRFSDLRGRWDSSRREFRAMAVYLSVKVKDAVAMATVTGLFVQSLSNYLISFRPNKPGKLRPYFLVQDEIDKATARGSDQVPIEGIFSETTKVLEKQIAQAKGAGRKTIPVMELRKLQENLKRGLICDDTGLPVGPAHVLFLLDEFPRLPKLDSLLVTPEVGRGQKLSMLLICQDLGQVQEKFGDAGVERFMTNSAGKIVLPLTNDKTAQRFAALAGKETVDARSLTGKEGFADMFTPKGYSTSKVGRELIFPNELMSMKDTFGPDKHIVFLQDFASRPIVCETPFFFKDAELRNLVHPEEIWGNSKGPDGKWKVADDLREAPPLPVFASAKRKIDAGRVDLLTDAEKATVHPSVLAAGGQGKGGGAKEEVKYVWMERDKAPDAKIFLIYPAAARGQLEAMGAREASNGDLFIHPNDDKRKFRQWLPLRDRFDFQPMIPEFNPESSLYGNLARLLEAGQWRNIRANLYAEHNNHCQLCGRQFGEILPHAPKTKVETQEVWRFSSDDEGRNTQKLDRLMCLCPDCKLTFHMGFAKVKGVYDQALSHYAWVNRLTIQDAEARMQAAFQLWEKRGEKDWTLNLAALSDQGRLRINPEAMQKGHKLPRIIGIDYDLPAAPQATAAQ